MFNAFPKVALLGRPNVGKSTLFNRLIRSNRAITHDRPGITRDRMEGIVQGRGQTASEIAFTLIDTGGVTIETGNKVTQGPEGLRGFEEDILDQAIDAAAESTVLCLVVDARDGLTPLDRHLADFVRKQDKPLLLVVNKVDGPEKAEILMAEFHELGMEMLPCSASHGFNVRELESRIRAFIEEKKDTVELELPESMQGATRRQKKRLLAEMEAAQENALNAEDMLEDIGAVESLEDEEGEGYGEIPLEGPAPLASPDSDEYMFEKEALAAAEKLVPLEMPFYTADGPLRLALLGRPNAGKSSLVNALSRQDRMIVSNIAGTTRDSVDVTAEIGGESCVFVDTAGVRRRSKITDVVERYSVNSSLKSTTKAHVTLLVLDGEEGLTQQDKRLIDLLNERKTPFMVLVNKCDLIPARNRKEAEANYKSSLAFCRHVPLLFISALKRRGLKQIVPLAREIRGECSVRIPTGQLNRAMNAVLDAHQPPVVKRVRAKFFYLTQPESSPPTFVFFVNNEEKVLPSYARYLERSLRRLFAIQHAPMRVHFRSSHKKKGQKA